MIDKIQSFRTTSPESTGQSKQASKENLPTSNMSNTSRRRLENFSHTHTHTQTSIYALCSLVVHAKNKWLSSQAEMNIQHSDPPSDKKNRPTKQTINGDLKVLLLQLPPPPSPPLLPP
jgi:hypothetical protein